MVVRPPWSPLLFLALAACAEPALVSNAGGGAGKGGKGGTAGAKGGSSGGGGGGGSFFDVPDGGGLDAAASNQKCAEEAHKAEIVPLDLMLLVDASSSMTGSTGMGTKWGAAQSALSAFVRDPRSAGLGVGLQFFPTEKERACKTDGDCGNSATEDFFCRPNTACVDATGLLPISCGAYTGDCPAGSTCRAVGRCSASGADCLDAGQACPGNGGTCVGGGKSCRFTFPNQHCEEANYRDPAVAIAGLPTNEMAVTRILVHKVPFGQTPMGPAVRGVLAHLRAHLMAHPGHKVALVLASDGLPGGCMMNDIPSIAGNLRAAFLGAPSIPTYVIGVFTPMELANARAQLDMLAMAGGTNQSFLLTSTPDLTQKLQQALDQIRGAALACELTIPAPAMGAIDFSRVNVRHTGAAGPEDLLYVETADRCDPTRGGWYYDVPPAQGTPTRILVCDASCRRFKMDATARVDLLFGCATKVIL
jgi:Mg-chelatase subunit ChlD